MSGHHDDKYHGKERRADRKEAREQKKEDIKSGETRKEAREDKHSMKKTDRQVWKEEGHSISKDMGTFVEDSAAHIVGEGDIVGEMMAQSDPNEEISKGG